MKIHVIRQSPLSGPSMRPGSRTAGYLDMLVGQRSLLRLSLCPDLLNLAE